MSASYKESRLYLTAHPTAESVCEAAALLDFRVMESSDGYIKLRTPLNLWSFGENITVIIATIDGRSLVEVTSSVKHLIKIEGIEIWKERDSVNRLFSAISEVLGNEGAFELLLRCSECDYTAAGLESKTCPECGADFQDGESISRQSQSILRLSTYFAAYMTAAEAIILLAFDAFGLRLPFLAPLLWLALFLVANFVTAVTLFWANARINRWAERKYSLPDDDT